MNLITLKGNIWVFISKRTQIVYIILHLHLFTLDPVCLHHLQMVKRLWYLRYRCSVTSDTKGLVYGNSYILKVFWVPHIFLYSSPLYVHQWFNDTFHNLSLIMAVQVTSSSIHPSTPTIHGMMCMLHWCWIYRGQ